VSVHFARSQGPSHCLVRITLKIRALSNYFVVPLYLSSARLAEMHRFAGWRIECSWEL